MVFSYVREMTAFAENRFKSYELRAWAEGS